MAASPYPPGYISDQPPGYISEQPVYQPMPSMLPSSGVISTQPGAPPGSVWIPLPPPIEGVPPGLEYLTMVNTVVIQQLYEVLELLTGWDCQNRYSLKNSNGEQVYFAAEESDCCERQCCGPQRGFEIHIVDNFKREVIRVSRPFKCWAGACCCLASIDCCAQECTIESPPGVVIGSVVQRATSCSIGFHLKDSDGNDIFEIEGPCMCLLNGCQDKEFPVRNMKGEEIGMICKKWGGFFREAFTDADVFCVSFPVDLDVRMKAILLGATFLIDFMMFEQPKNNN